MLFPSKSDELSQKQASVERLFESHFERVAKYIAMRIGSTSDAEDMAGEVFVRALHAVDKYKETGAPMESWLFKIARNICIDYLRKRGRRPAVPLDDNLSLPSKDDPIEYVERKQEIEELNQAMAQLTETQRQVLTLRFGGEMTSEQAAQVLGKKAGAVREAQSAAIKKLRELLRG